MYQRICIGRKIQGQAVLSITKKARKESGSRKAKVKVTNKVKLDGFKIYRASNKITVARRKG